MLADLGRRAEWVPVEVLDRVTLAPVRLPVRLPVRPAGARPGLLVAATAEGEERAIPDRCPHRGRPLAEYARAGRRPGTIVCTAHGLEFDVASGRCLNPAGTDRPPALRSWPVLDRPDGTSAAVLDDDLDDLGLGLPERSGPDGRLDRWGAWTEAAPPGGGARGPADGRDRDGHVPVAPTRCPAPSGPHHPASAPASARPRRRDHEERNP